jgi:hypothetical protein
MAYYLPWLAAPAPAWAAGLAVNAWREITGTTISGSNITVNPYSLDPVGIVDFWNGAAFDDANLDYYYLGTGGHTDWAGNQILRLRLSSAAPAWTQLVASSAAGTMGAVGSNDANPFGSDGRPKSHHSYYVSQWIKKAGRGFNFGQGAIWNNGGVTGDMSAYVSGASDWENTAGNYALWGQLSAAQNESTRACVKHPTTEDVYYSATSGGNPVWYRWSISGTTPGSASHTAMAVPAVNLSYYAGATDTTRNRIVLFNGNTTTARIYDVAGNSWSSATLSGGSAATITAGADYAGMVYSPTTDLFYVRIRSQGNADLYTINPSTFAVGQLGLSGSGPANDSRGPNGRMQYAQNIGGGMGGVFFQATAGDNMRFARLH